MFTPTEQKRLNEIYDMIVEYPTLQLYFELEELNKKYNNIILWMAIDTKNIDPQSGIIWDYELSDIEPEDLLDEVFELISSKEGYIFLTYQPDFPPSGYKYYNELTKLANMEIE